MHSLVIVLLPPDTRDIRKTISELIAPYRIDDDNPDPEVLKCRNSAELNVVIARVRKRFKWDYWTFSMGWVEHYGIKPPEWADEDKRVRMNVCPVAQLPADIDCGGVVEPDGAWHEPEDFGWRMLNTPAKNAVPLARWKERSTDLLNVHRDCVAVLIDCHC
jgi:hypothetical protein